MDIDRRTLVTSGIGLAGLPFLGAAAMAEGAGRVDLPKGGIVLTATVIAKKEHLDAVKEALTGLVEPTRKESGCLCYNLHQSKSEPTEFLFYELWAGQEAIDAHSKTPHMKALGAKLKDKTEGGVKIALYDLLE